LCTNAQNPIKTGLSRVYASCSRALNVPQYAVANEV
jgi:hypothetical protein